MVSFYSMNRWHDKIEDLVNLIGIDQDLIAFFCFFSPNKKYISQTFHVYHVYITLFA